MSNDNVKIIIVEILQSVLSGQLKPEANINPQTVADSIIQRVNFGTSIGEHVNKKFIQEIIDSVQECQKEMDVEFEKLNPETDNLLRNFIRGKSHAYLEILDILNKL